MNKFDYDLFVIGAGSGGVRASRLAANFGARVGICEEDRIGGTCVIRGCIPKKLFVYSAHYSEDFQDAVSYGWSETNSIFDWRKLLENKNKEIDRLNEIYINILKKNNVDIFSCHGKLIDNHTIELSGKKITSEKILISTGGSPAMPELVGIENAISSNEAFHLKNFPESIIIIGGGYIATEFSSIFNGLGSQVTQVYRGNQILRGFDLDIRNALSQEMQKKGINFKFNENIIKIEESNHKKIVTLASNEVLEADIVMFAVGRKPNIENLGLEKLGIKSGTKNQIIVDEWHRTNIENIFAIGDVTDKINLTPVALNEGICFAQTVFGGIKRKMDYRYIPSAVFSNPNLASVGLTESDAKEKFERIDVYISNFTSLRHTLTGRNEQTLLKVIVDNRSKVVLGIHMVGSEAGEIIQGLAVGIKMGMLKDDLDATIGIHPTTAEEFVTMREKTR